MTSAADDDRSAIAWPSLVARCIAGDAPARNELVLRFHPRVRELVHRELTDDFRKRHRWMLALFSTRDVVQEVLAAVVDALETGEFPDEDAFASYLATMVKHRLLDAVRHHEAQKRDVRREARETDPEVLQAQPDPDARTPALAAQLSEQAAMLNAVLDAFEPRRKALLSMRLIDEETFPAIAHKLGYASAETARQAFVESQARLLVKLRAAGLRPPGETLR